MPSEQNMPESRESRTGWGQTAYKRRLAYEYLGIDPNTVQTVPFFRTNLRRIARCINRGAGAKPMRPLAYVCCSEDPEARRVAKLYTTVPESYRRLVPAEAYCQAAGVSPYRVLEIITGIAVRFGARASTVLASVMLPHVVQKTIDKAMQNEGTKERELFFRATG